MMKKSRKRGFTLTEIAIVLSIIGLVIGAVWIAAGSVNSNQKISTTSGQFMTILQGIRTLYATSNGTGISDTTSMNFNLCSANVFPATMITTTGATPCGTLASPNPITDAWNGAVTVASSSVTTAGTGDAIYIQMAGLDQKACISLLVQLGGLSRDSGLIYLVGGSAPTAYTAGTTQPSAVKFPITPTEAKATGYCVGTSTNTIIAAFSLKG